MKKFALLLICLMAMFRASAVPAYPYPVTVTQPDGSTLVIQGHGDEFYHFTTTADGYTIVKNEMGFFTSEEQRGFHMLEKRLARLRDEAQLLREYCLQVRELFQAELDIRQNRIMKILTIVTTVFLPLSLVAGWYGMNFTGMPELRWAYGYPAVIAASVVIVLLSLWVMKKKKFW